MIIPGSGDSSFGPADVIGGTPPALSVVLPAAWRTVVEFVPGR
jgi:hypothetical protein